MLERTWWNEVSQHVYLKMSKTPFKKKMCIIFRWKKTAYITVFHCFSRTYLLWNQKLVTNIRLTWKHSDIVKGTLWISVFQKKKLLRNILFSAHLLYLNKSKCCPYFEFVQTFKRTGDGRWFYVKALSIAS